MSEHPRRDPQRTEPKHEQHPEGGREKPGEAPGGDAVRSRSADPGQSSYGGFRDEGDREEGRGRQPGAGPEAGTKGPDSDAAGQPKGAGQPNVDGPPDAARGTGDSGPGRDAERPPDER
jgi:hypothetical protein